jgi:hypothetical protein
MNVNFSRLISKCTFFGTFKIQCFPYVQHGSQSLYVGEEIEYINENVFPNETKLGKATTNAPKAKLTNKKRGCHRKIRQKRRLLIWRLIQILKKNLDLDNLAFIVCLFAHCPPPPPSTLHIFLLFIRFGPNISWEKKSVN